MAKEKTGDLLPAEPEVDEETGETTSPEDQKALDGFYREHPDAMRKWIDTDDSAFGAFPDAEEDDEGATDNDLESDEPSDTE